MIYNQQKIIFRCLLNLSLVKEMDEAKDGFTDFSHTDD